MKRSTHVAPLDALRGLAALSVVFFHAHLLYQQSKDVHDSALQGLLNALHLTPLLALFAGQESVLVFFILSGLVLFLMLDGRGMPYPAYVRKRLVRLYPPYIVAVLVSMALATLLGLKQLPGLGEWVNSLWQQPPTLQAIAAHALVIGHTQTEPYNFVIWSLVQEIQISLIFPLLYWVLLRFKPITVLALFGSLSVLANGASYVLAHRAPGAEQALMPYLNTLHYLVFFAIGGLMAKHRVSLGAWYRSLPPAHKATLVLVGVLSYTYGGAIMDRVGIDSRIGDLLILPGAFVFVLLFSYSARVARFAERPALQFLGKISYSLYLYHAVVLLAFVFGLSGVLPLEVVLGLGLLAVIPVSTLAYYLVEQPSIAWSRTSTPRGKAQPTKAAQGEV